jgi:hypothetical protein
MRKRKPRYENIYYLARELAGAEGKASVYDALAERLNKDRHRTPTGLRWDRQTLNNVLRGQVYDPVVEIELLIMIAEQRGKAEQVSDLLDQVRKILKIKTPKSNERANLPVPELAS